MAPSGRREKRKLVVGEMIGGRSWQVDCPICCSPGHQMPFGLCHLADRCMDPQSPCSPSATASIVRTTLALSPDAR